MAVIRGKEVAVPGDAANKVPGYNLYHGQGLDDASQEALTNAGWKRVFEKIGPMQSSDLKNLLLARGDSATGWQYYMEKFVSPSGLTEIKNHFWENASKFPGEYYHHH